MARDRGETDGVRPGESTGGRARPRRPRRRRVGRLEPHLTTGVLVNSHASWSLQVSNAASPLATSSSETVT
jgi:hypothetical protein